MRDRCRPSRRNFPATPAPLEAAFWRCDYDATQDGMQHVDVDACTRVYEAIKHGRFGGDFGRLLAWWNERRDVEHARLRAAPRASTAR